MRYVYIAILGLVGIFLRYEIGLFASRHFPTNFPIATFFINIVGSFFIGMLWAFAFEKSGMSEDLRIGFTVGLLGGFTTFSSYSLESVQLFESGKIGTGLAYFTLSPLLCLAAAYAGLVVTRLVLNTAR